MPRIDWNTSGSRVYESGVDRGVLYIDALAGVPWVGLISVEGNPTGGDAKPRYIDGMKYLNISATEEFEATINAYTYPVQFSQCDGTARARAGLFFGQQKRKSFGFSYRTGVGNDTEGVGFGYKLHLVYNALAAPAGRSDKTYGDSAEASDFTWSITTKSRMVAGYHSTAHVVVDSRFTHPITLAAIEDILYGGEDSVSRLPTPEELMAIFDTPVEFVVVSNGGGSFTITGPEASITDIGLGIFTISDPGVVDLGDGLFAISS